MISLMEMVNRPSKVVIIMLVDLSKVSKMDMEFLNVLITPYIKEIGKIICLMGRVSILGLMGEFT